jgi:hypothetical protein
MTAGGTATPHTPPNGGAFTQSATPAPAPPPPPYGVDPRYTGGRRRGRGALVAIVLGVVAVLLAGSALVVALTGIGRQPVPGVPAAAPSQTAASTADADRALCTAIAPLMGESNKQANTFVGLGDTGTPTRDAALPKFVSDTEDWARRTQAVLDSHPDAQPFLKRTLQRYIDDMTLYVRNVRPGPQQTYDTAAWSDSLVAYGGPLAICQDLGIKW